MVFSWILPKIELQVLPNSKICSGMFWKIPTEIFGSQKKNHFFKVCLSITSILNSLCWEACVRQANKFLCKFGANENQNFGHELLEKNAMKFPKKSSILPNTGFPT